MHIVASDRSWNALRHEAMRVLRDVLTCAYCKEQGTDVFGPDGKHWSIDHVIPKDKGGSSDMHNLVKACHRCNSRKHTKTTPEWTPTDDVMTAAGVPFGGVQQNLFDQTDMDDVVIRYEKVINGLQNRIYILEQHIWNQRQVLSSIKLLTEATQCPVEIIYNPSDVVWGSK